MKTALALALAFATSAPALALDACPSPELLTGSASSFEDVYSARSGIALEKGEFETTEQFEARKAAAGNPEPVLMQVALEPDAFEYDADSQHFVLSSYAFETPSLMFVYDMSDEAAAPYEGKGNTYKPVSLSIEEVLVSESVRQAQNGYGAVFEVTDRVTIERLIFERPGRKGAIALYDTLFGQAESKREEFDAKLSVPVPLSEAPAMKAGLNAVVWAEPNAPFFDEQKSYSGARSDRPVSRSTTYEIIHADIKCFGVRDGEGNLLAHWATR